jgi:hypothetical protein
LGLCSLDELGHALLVKHAQTRNLGEMQKGRRQGCMGIYRMKQVQDVQDVSIKIVAIVWLLER